MSETLTTLEMLSELKEGQIAEIVSEHKETVTYLHIIKRNGYRWYERNHDKDISLVALTEVFMNGYKWRILPQFVEFHEAMKALKEGKTIKSYVNGEAYKFHFLEGNPEFDIHCLDAVEILEGKWVIEE